MVETTLETTHEAPGACAVCPWDMPEPTVETTITAAAISVSVCPWESEVELPSQQQQSAAIAQPLSSAAARY